MERYAEEIGVEFNSLQEYRRVASAYEMSTRVDKLTFSHHRDIGELTELLRRLRESWKPLSRAGISSQQASRWESMPTRPSRLARPRRFSCFKVSIDTLNFHRRHLNESQRAMIADSLAVRPVGHPIASIDAITQEQAAALLKVGRAQVQRARKVREMAAPNLQ